MINISKLLRSIFTILVLSQCSFDPKLEDLKIRFIHRDGISGRGTLYNWHCCKAIIQNTSVPTDPLRGSTIVKANKKQSSTQKGEFVAAFPSTYTVGTQLAAQLLCFNISALNPDPTAQLTDDNCKQYEANGYLVSYRKFSVTASNSYEFEI